MAMANGGYSAMARVVSVAAVPAAIPAAILAAIPTAPIMARQRGGGEVDSARQLSRGSEGGGGEVDSSSEDESDLPDVSHYYLALVNDEKPDEVAAKIASRYQNLALVSSLVMMVAATGLLSPTAADIKGIHTDAYGILAGLAFVSTMISALISLIFMNTVSLMPVDKEMMMWYTEFTRFWMKLPIWLLIFGCVCSMSAMGIHLYANLGTPSCIVTLLFFVVLGILSLYIYHQIMKVSKSQIKRKFKHVVDHI